MEIMTRLLKLGIIINNCSHWILAPEDPCPIGPPCSNDNLEISNNHSRLFAADRVALNYIPFVDFIQQIQITQFHDAEICWIMNGSVGGDWEISHHPEIVPQWC
jgi:hypothetical protein